MKLLILVSVAAFALSSIAQAKQVIPMGRSNNTLYYKMGGGSDFAMPPVSDTTTVRLDTKADLGLGNSCQAFNPALSVTNTINDLKDSADNLEQSVIASATGSLIQLPMYLLSQANPTAYNLLNNALLNAHNKISVSTKSCEMIKNQISNGKNPYQDWGTIAVGDQWKKQLSLTATGDADINQSKKEIDAHSGETGVTWVQGNADRDGSVHAGGKGQPPVHVIADTTKAGFNAMLNRDLQSDENITSGELALYFNNPRTASMWITSIVGDQVITTCNDDSCKKDQASIVGHGLLPWVTSCQIDKDNCSDTIRDELSKLATDNDVITKDNLLKVSANGIAISPDVITSIRGMDSMQQIIIINKLSQEISVQRVMDKAFIAKEILSTGSQVPAIASNHPAQAIINHALAKLDNDIKSLAFESQMRKQTTSTTISEILKYKDQQQQNAMSVPVATSPQLMVNGAISG